jgi:hypothetical protein
LKNEARVEVEKEGEPMRVLKSEPLVSDPFTALATPGHIHASVGFSLGTQQDFGRLKITSHVNVTCDQSTQVMNEAGRMSFEKGLEFLNDGLSILAAEGVAGK